MHSQRLLSFMKEKGFDEKECLEAIKYLEKQGFLNDSDFVSYFVKKWQKQGKSSLEIRNKARLQCIPLQEITGFLHDREALQTLIAKKYPQLLDGIRDQKAILALRRKGFSVHAILEVLNQKSYNIS